MKIKKLFKIISKKENHKFEINDFYIPKTIIKIKDENDIDQLVIGMIIKEDEIIKIITKNYKLKVGSKHIIVLNDGTQIFANQLKTGMILKNLNGDEEIINIVFTNKKQKVYDLSINNNTLLYSDSNGFIHHNSFTVLKKMIGENFEVFKGGITSASALFKTLFMHNDPEKIIIFDDLDSLLQDPVCTRMLKGALDSGENTEVAYISKNNVEPLFYDVLTEKQALTPDVIEKLEKLKISTTIFETTHGQHSKAYNQMKQRALNPDLPNAIFPNKFDFIGRTIFISNFYLDQIPGSLISRNAFIEVNLTLDQIVRRIEQALPNIEINGVKYDMKIKKEAMNYVKKVLIPSGRIRKIDFRGFGDIMKFAASEAPTEIWYRWASVAMKQKYGEVEKQVNRPKR